ncbi:MAG: cytochrome C [Myxococcaceae bacterium]|nr:cytochrome C [Myxococcaceae bacterium]
MFKAFFEALFRSWLSIVGSVLTTVSAGVFLVLLVVAELNPGFGGGYGGIVAFLFLPPFFVLGLVLIPLGLARARRRKEPARAPVIDFNLPRTRALATVVGALTVVNVGVVGTATYKGVSTMESPEFCGGACHSVMHPEYAAWQRGPHSKVACTRCHVGSGAEWFVRGKATGVRQLVSVARGTFERPIPTPVENLRPANETCEGCHARDRIMRDRLKVFDRFAEDEGNTWKKTVLLNKTKAVHWHLDGAVRFRSDRRRLVVAEVARPLPDGGVRTWRNEALDGGAALEVFRTMDCTDCHNRPAHAYQRPKDEVDRALASGALDRTLPFVRREGLRLLLKDWPSWDAARAGIATELKAFYAAGYAATVTPGRAEAAATTLFELYQRNVFPEMKVGWKTYPDFRDHEDDSGCFRCHSSDLVSADGAKIPTRCEVCHVTLAEEEEQPEILDALSGE